MILQFGYDMMIPIPDLRLDDAGIYGTLSFDRESFHVTVPWHAVYALILPEGRGWVWCDAYPCATE